MLSLLLIICLCTYRPRVAWDVSANLEINNFLQFDILLLKNEIFYACLLIGLYLFPDCTLFTLEVDIEFWDKNSEELAKNDW